eukprot:TRINITY_DN66813_c0_g1_i1.p1 TRINITY_DN66813_c0_g1~~TRINITY_DN66813_c0_g1_i1.p1  ORF type:complete len:219 (-),score=37.94 TRINITY_DN66813_c0_g1_i1:220-798(-)
MTTTLLAVFATPMCCQIFLGTIVPVDATGILMTAIQMVLIPVWLGVSASSLAPSLFAVLTPTTTKLAMAGSLVAIGSIVGGCADHILSGGLFLHMAVTLLHTLAAFFGYFLCAAVGCDENQRRTVAIETAMKNAAFATVLAASHFEEDLIRAPAAVSCMWCPALASLLAAVWSQTPLRTSNADGSWAAEYKA